MEEDRARLLAIWEIMGSTTSRFLSKRISSQDFTTHSHSKTKTPLTTTFKSELNKEIQFFFCIY
jgi:hypothetical protein